METFAKDFVTLLQYLLPGFVAAWVFYSFTSFPKPSQFERVVQALIFTVFVQALVYIIKRIFFFVGKKWPVFIWNTHSDIIWSIILAILLGILFSYFANNDKIHKKLRDWGITRETSYPSEWFGAFLQNITYVVLHLDGERRLYGWPKEWPSEPEKGHFVLIQASWLDEYKDIPITGVDSIMVDAKEVKMVEFMEKTWEVQNEQEKFKSTTP
jgi:energy-coupling factor transporter transmembrane protein EcfT